MRLGTSQTTGSTVFAASIVGALILVIAPNAMGQEDGQAETTASSEATDFQLEAGLVADLGLEGERAVSLSDFLTYGGQTGKGLASYRARSEAHVVLSSIIDEAESTAQSLDRGVKMFEDMDETDKVNKESVYLRVDPWDGRLLVEAHF